MAQRLGQQRVALVVSQQLQRQRAVGHGGQDRREAVGFGQPLDHPVAGALERDAAQGRRARQSLADLQQAIDGPEQRLPVGAARAVVASGRRLDVLQQLGDAARGRQRDDRLGGPDDRQRHEDRPRPAGHVVDRERRALRREHHLGRHGGNGLPGDLPEHRQVRSRVRVGAADAAQRLDGGARGPHVRRVGRLARDLQREVAETRNRDVRRAAQILVPAAAGQRLVANDAGQGSDFFGIATSEERLQQNDVAFERRVPLQLRQPVPVGVLARDQPVAGGGDRRLDARARRRGEQQAARGCGGRLRGGRDRFRGVVHSRPRR